MTHSASSPSSWDKCRTCGKPIGFRSKYWTCSVSSCNRKSNPLVFCSVDCWDIHAPVMNHKNAGAEENFSPAREAVLAASPAGPTPVKSGEKDILIVASKLKQYIRDQSGMNTSASVMDCLSDIVRKHCDQAIKRANMDNRKTVMDRDFE